MMKIEQLKEVLELHKKWLNFEKDGVRANLSEADLYEADLYGADLRGADLYGAKYGDVILKGTPFQIYTNIYYVLIFHEHIKIGCEFHSTKEWENFTDKEILAMDSKTALSFWKKWKDVILQMAKLRNL